MDGVEGWDSVESLLTMKENRKEVDSILISFEAQKAKLINK